MQAFNFFSKLALGQKPPASFEQNEGIQNTMNFKQFVEFCKQVEVTRFISGK